MKRAFIIVLVVLAIDQILKLYVKTHFSYNESYVIANWFQIHFTENPGMAFGLEWGGNTGKYMLSIFRLVAIVALFFWLKRLIQKSAKPLAITAVSLIFAGAVGNMIDSAFYGLIFDSGLLFNPEIQDWVDYAGVSQFGSGYNNFLLGNVVDMLYFPLYRGYLPDWVPIWGGDYFIFFRPIFNIADTAISIGVGILIFFQKKTGLH